MHLEEVGVAEHEPCIVLIGTTSLGADAKRQGRAMPEQIDIPASFAGAADVTGKRVVITGAGRGLGRLLAHAFSHGGARVALVARTETDLKAVAAELPGPSLVLERRRDRRGASTRRSPTPRSPNGAASTCGSATRGSRPILAGPRETDPSVWREILDVNLTGAFLGARAAARVMHDGRATDLHRLGARRTAARRAHRVQRVEGRPRRPGEGPRARSRAVGHHRERRRAGWFDSPLAERWKNSPELGAGVLGHTAQRRWGAPTDLAGAYQFLASDASAFVTGTVLNVDGGYLLV